MLVVLLVIATIWVERDRHDPVAGYGVLDARGVAVASGDEGVTVGQPAPIFRLQATNGDILALDDLAGHPVVLQFWTSWCLDCVDAIPIFQQVASTHVDRVTVLGIAPEETASRTDGALDRAGATYLTLLDNDGTVSERYGATPLPLTVVIDGNGQIVAVHAGRVSVAQIETDLAPILP